MKNKELTALELELVIGGRGQAVVMKNGVVKKEPWPGYFNQQAFELIRSQMHAY